MFAGKLRITHAKIPGQLLQLTVLITDAVEAVHIMV